MSQQGELGRTRLYTRRERHRRQAGIVLALVGAALAAWIAAALVSWIAGTGLVLPQMHLRPPVTGGSGGLLGLPTHGQPTAPGRRAQPPFTVDWPVSPVWTAVAAVPLWVAWLRFAVGPVLAGLRTEVRHRGLASVRSIRHALGARRVRRAGRYTLPAIPWYRRWLLPTSKFGFFLGHPERPRAPRMVLWANWEQRVRIVARPGWGKTTRLLIPTIRALPGPALVSSTEPAIFYQTVLARQQHRPCLRWAWLTVLAKPWLRTQPRPVAVVDFSGSGRRYAAGYPRVRWNPILECTQFTVAHRRAAALVAASDSPIGTMPGSDNDQFFRDSATEVLAAWLHAAALATKALDDLLDWARTPTDPVPARILEDDHRAEPSALLNLHKHLDPRAEKTTSGVERYLILALNALATTEGRALCDIQAVEQFDMSRFITAGGTVYLLADPALIDRTRPLLSLFAAEMFLAAEHAALQQPTQRLPRPFIAVLDELRYGITIPNLPYVATAQRKYNIGFIYAVQSSAQETALYGPDAEALRAAAGVTLIGGIDIPTAQELADRAGTTPVVTATRGHDHRTLGDTTRNRHTHSEHIEHQPALTISDQQRLPDGHAVLLHRGLAPFITTVPSIYEQPRLRRCLNAEATAVTARAHAANQADAAITRSRTTAADLGASLTLDDPTLRP